jgi:hypothetical protein
MQILLVMIIYFIIFLGNVSAGLQRVAGGAVAGRILAGQLHGWGGAALAGGRVAVAGLDVPGRPLGLLPWWNAAAAAALV